MKIKRQLAVLKYTMYRGYSWGQMPTMAIIGAGVLKLFLATFGLLNLIGVIQ